jgi:hypothetical protein
MTSLNDQSMNSNRRIKVNFDGGNLTNDAGLLLYKEFNEKMGLYVKKSLSQCIILHKHLNVRTFIND